MKDLVPSALTLLEMGQVKVHFSMVTIGEAEDLHAVIQHFSGANRLISAILGHSKGGNVVLLYASKDHDIYTVVNVSGHYNLKGGIEDRLGKDFIERIKKDGFFDVKNRSGEVDYCVTEESVMGRLNTNMHEACLNIDKECSDCLRMVEGADHGYTSHRTELASVVIPFIKEGLQQGS